MHRFIYKDISMKTNKPSLQTCVVAESRPTFLRPHGLQPTRFCGPWNFPGKNIGVGCHFLLQGIFLTQGLNLCLLHWQVDSSPLSHQGSPSRSLEHNLSLKIANTGGYTALALLLFSLGLSSNAVLGSRR